MTDEKKYFVTHSAGNILCDHISREKNDGTYEHLSYQDIVDKLNNLVKENRQLKNDLKKQFKAIAKTTDEFNSTIDTKTLIQLFKDSNELKEIKDENQRLIKMLDNVANCMQNQNKDIPIDDFVELWNKMATKEVLELKLIQVLRNHYLECQKWNDTHTQLIIKQIAQDLNVDLE